jgi:hypothetical protein
VKKNSPAEKSGDCDSMEDGEKIQYIDPQLKNLGKNPGSRPETKRLHIYRTACR